MDFAKGIFNAFKSFGKIEKEVKKEFAKKAFNAILDKGAEMIAEQHRGKQYTATLYDKNNIKHLTIFFLPETDRAIVFVNHFISSNKEMPLFGGFKISFAEVQPEVYSV